MSYPSTLTVFYDQVFDTTRDIVITLDYSATTLASTLSGGIVFGILPHYRVAPDNFSTADGLGYSASTTVSAASGILDTQVGVGLDFSGDFATASNAIAVRGRAQDQYPLIFTTGNLSAAPVPFTLADGTMKRVRFRLAEFGTRVVVDCKNINERVFTQYVDTELNYSTPQYCRIYLGFTTNTADTYIAVQNINVNAYNQTLTYMLSSADYFGQIPLPATLNEGDTITCINTHDTSGIPHLGTLLYIENPASGAPYVGSEFISVTYQ